MVIRRLAYRVIAHGMRPGAWLHRALDRGGFLCIYCRRPTRGVLHAGIPLALCEPCHQAELPEVPHR